MRFKVTFIDIGPELSEIHACEFGHAPKAIDYLAKIGHEYYKIRN